MILDNGHIPKNKSAKYPTGVQAVINHSGGSGGEDGGINYE